MKTLKSTAALIITALVFFSCAQEDIVNYGNPSYGTLVIKTIGTVLTSDPDAKTHIEDLNLVFDFECTNEKANINTQAGPYDVKESKNVLFQLPPGDWNIKTNVTADNEGIIGYSNQYVTIKAGQITYLYEKVYTAVNGRAAAPKVTDQSFIDGGYLSAANSNWDKSPALKINVFQKLNPSSGLVSGTGTYREGAYGTAKALRDDNYLYVLVLVKDADLSLTNKIEHDSNSVEIFYKEREGRIHQYRIDSDAIKTYAIITAPSIADKAQPFPSTVNLGLATNKPDSVDYAVVAKIPINISEKIGFDLQINGAPKSGTDVRYSNAVWCKDIEVFNSGSLPDSLYLAE